MLATVIKINIPEMTSSDHFGKWKNFYIQCQEGRNDKTGSYEWEQEVGGEN